MIDTHIQQIRFPWYHFIFYREKPCFIALINKFTVKNNNRYNNSYTSLTIKVKLTFELTPVKNRSNTEKIEQTYTPSG